MASTKKLLVILLMTSACLVVKGQSGKADLQEARKAISASNAIYFESFVKNDPEIFKARYAKDACILAPNSPKVCGPAAAENFFKFAYEDLGLRNGKFTTTAVYGSGNEFVVEEGLYESFDGNGKLTDDGKFLVLWKKTSEGWKMFRDSFSSNRPQK